jgi:hypothetical protein
MIQQAPKKVIAHGHGPNQGDGDLSIIANSAE